MKYYCKNCGTEFAFTDDYFTKYGEENCLLCGNDDPDYEMIPIPDYETPLQYEKRTGKIYPAIGLVWFRYREREDVEHSDEESIWQICHYTSAEDTKKYYGDTYKYDIVIASPPVPPPDDFVPEEDIPVSRIKCVRKFKEANNEGN